MQHYSLEKVEKMYDSPKIVHADAGATMTADYEPKDSYFTVLDSDGRVLEENRNAGKIWSVEAEYRSIEWAVNNVSGRPLIITNDNEAALKWSRKGASTDKHDLPPLVVNKPEVEVAYQKHNLADVYNAKHIEDKHIPDRYKEKYENAG